MVDAVMAGLWLCTECSGRRPIGRFWVTGSKGLTYGNGMGDLSGSNLVPTLIR